MEPQAQKLAIVDEPTIIALTSVAISMKRIADQLCGHPQQFGLVDGIMHAIEQGIISARNG